MTRATTTRRRTRKPIRRQPTTTAPAGYDDWTCPNNPEHGRLLDYYSGTAGYCPHSECNGAGTRAFWTIEELRELRAKP